MASYQDIEMRLRVMEDKVAFIMNFFKLGLQSPIEGAPPKFRTLFELYLEAKQAAVVPVAEKAAAELLAEDADNG